MEQGASRRYHEHRVAGRSSPSGVHATRDARVSFLEPASTRRWRHSPNPPRAEALLLFVYARPHPRLVLAAACARSSPNGANLHASSFALGIDHTRCFRCSARRKRAREPIEEYAAVSSVPRTPFRVRALCNAIPLNWPPPEMVLESGVVSRDFVTVHLWWIKILRNQRFPVKVDFEQGSFGNGCGCSIGNASQFCSRKSCVGRASASGDSAGSARQFHRNDALRDIYKVSVLPLWPSRGHLIFPWNRSALLQNILWDILYLRDGCLL